MDWKHIKEKLVSHALEEALVAIGTGILIARPMAENYLAQYAQTLTPLATVRIISTLLAGVCLALAFAFYNRPKFKFSQRDGGVWVDKKTEIRYCPNCMTKKLKTPLINHNDMVWLCPSTDCQQKFIKKLREPPTERH